EHRLRDLLQEGRLARPGRRDDEPALALADRREEVEHAHRELAGLGLQAQPLIGLDRRERFENGFRLRMHATDSAGRERTTRFYGRPSPGFNQIAETGLKFRVSEGRRRELETGHGTL